MGYIKLLIDKCHNNSQKCKKKDTSHTIGELEQGLSEDIDNLIRLYTIPKTPYNINILFYRRSGWKVSDSNMGMTDKQFNGFIRFILDDINEVIEALPDGKERDRLQKIADNLQKTLED